MRNTPETIKNGPSYGLTPLTISQSVPVSTNGNIPLYVSLYSRQGSLQGWLTLTNNSTNHPPQTVLGTNLTWIKLFSRAGTLYAGCFTNTNITVLGSFYLPPQSGAMPLTLSNGNTLTISNGNLGGALIYSNLAIEGDKLVNNGSGNPTNQLTGVITPGTGVLTVSFRPTDARTDTVARGVVLQDDQTTNAASTNAAGWFLGPDQSGFFLLQQ